MTKKANVAIVHNSPVATNLSALLSSRGYVARSITDAQKLLASVPPADGPGVVVLDAPSTLKRVDTPKVLKASYPQAETLVMSADGQLSPAATSTALEHGRLQPTAIPVAGMVPQPGADEDDDGCIWGTGDVMRSISRTIDQIADCDVPVLLRGESGVGKGLIAEAIHKRSTRRSKAFVKVNCASLPVELLESELFGHERGAFTGAVSTRIGKFEQADGGTLLLDEIAEMKPALQAKLLHVLQDSEFTRLGSNKLIRTDVRIVAATNCNLDKMRLSGEFREDLYFRLCVIELTVPALRERREDIPRLLESFLTRFSREYGRLRRPLSVRIRQLFADYDWPGNVRELENMVKRIVVLQDEEFVARDLQQKLAQIATAVRAAATPAIPPPSSATSPAAKLAGAGARGGAASSRSVPRVATFNGDSAGQDPRLLMSVARAAAVSAEGEAIAQTLSKVQWNRRKAAQMLGVSYKTLLNKMKVCGLARA